MAQHNLEKCLFQLIGSEESVKLLQSLEIVPALLNTNDTLSRAQIAMLMNILLFKDLLERVPESKNYTEEQIQKQRRIVFDHGALRTVAIDMEHLPKGRLAFARILEPLGYEITGEYPLDKLKMCGFVFTHKDYPEDIPQYFVSELYPERFGPAFISTVNKLTYNSVDPLTNEAKDLLAELKTKQKLNVDSSIHLLKILPTCFDRQHKIPTLDQYRYFLSESPEMAWISTEGNAFNHATDRVSNLDLLEEQERLKGRNLKPQIEEGKHAKIRQTAYRASIIERCFKIDDRIIQMQVPGSFFEFIERGTIVDPISGEERLDLRFDSKNAQGIFKMTEKKPIEN